MILLGSSQLSNARGLATQITNANTVGAVPTRKVAAQIDDPAAKSLREKEAGASHRFASRGSEDCDEILLALGFLFLREFGIVTVHPALNGDHAV